ncbi:acyltransferase domain-containing protein [Streptomyces johnsoniae]|uniref:Acyltransferase domain-containing protein n=1 Tax=Streptomyces johnsoniae TaxID=3075532 RepID=A0ABU2S640_9ACTN|nr:acyltransferase domain-containing protein [Streptomyces sp. DSM 41886]MDT0444382.1 acyltransferase domain-containing protein [Streptomyces sp. DSM 41886]
MLELPSNAEAARLLERLGARAVDRAETLAARPDPRKHRELWRHLEGCYGDLMSRMGSGLPVDGYRGFPAMPVDANSVALHLYVWLYLAVLPETLRYHAERGIDRATSWETLSTLGPMMAEHRAVHGLGGIGRFGQWCPPLKFRGAEYRLGRLEYDRGRGELPDGTTGFLLHLHIPSGAPLSPEACDVSFDLAREFFGRHFPDEPVSYLVCHSWLLDPQITEYLPERSNIVRFLRRFELKPFISDDQEHADGDMLEYIFGRPSQSDPVTDGLLTELPQDTSLRRAYTAHLRSGRHWHARTGRIVF